MSLLLMLGSCSHCQKTKRTSPESSSIFYFDFLLHYLRLLSQISYSWGMYFPVLVRVFIAAVMLSVVLSWHFEWTTGCNSINELGSYLPWMCYLQKKLSGHPNIVQFCSAASIGKEESDTGQGEFLLLTELCKGKFYFFS